MLKRMPEASHALKCINKSRQTDAMQLIVSKNNESIPFYSP